VSAVIYAIGDIHGEKAMLDEMHRRILVDAENRPGDKLAVYLGDYIDRGPDSAGVVATLMNSQLPFPTICLLGNHEDLCLGNNRYLWLRNGGDETEASYGGNVEESHKAWMRGLPLSHRVGKWFFVHAGIDPYQGLAVQDRESLLWMRRPFVTYRGKMPEGVTVVHGHTPGKIPNILHNRIGLDTGACYGGALSCGVLTTNLERIIRVTAEETYG
jgi:serine/threonine protein phosphatase 1